MRIVIGADHAGFELKGYLATFLRERGFQVVDVGTFNTETVDYPDFAEAVGLSLLKKQADRRILICCSGVGAAVAATKLPGIRAGLCHDTYSAHQGVEHDDMNILVIAADFTDERDAKAMLIAFLETKFAGKARYERRLQEIREIEVNN